FVVPAAVADGKIVSFVGDCHKSETAFSFAHLVDSLAIRTALDGWLLVQRGRAHHWNRRATARREIAMSAVVGGEHVGIAMQNGHARDVIGFDEVGNLSAFITVD